MFISRSVSAQASVVATTTHSERMEELKRHISALSCGGADTTVLKRLVIICVESTVEETLSSPSSPTTNNLPSPSPLIPYRSVSSLHSDMWETNRLFEQFFNALNAYLEPSRVRPSSNYLRNTFQTE
jgi:CLIP-associating protein 1/2